MQRAREEKVFGEIRLARPAKPAAEKPLAEPRRVNCPLCKNVIVVPDEQKAAELDCMVCGMAFHFTLPQESPTELPRGPLENWLAGKPVKLRRLNRWEQFHRWCAERPYLVGTTAGMLLVLTLVCWFSVSAYRNACLHLRDVSQQLEQWHRQQEDAHPTPTQQAEKIAAPTADPPATVVVQSKPAEKAPAKPADPPAATVSQDKPVTKAVAKSSDTPAIATPQNKVATKSATQPSNPPAASAATDKKIAKTAAKPTDSAVKGADANSAQDLSLPSLGTAQRDATLR